MVPWMVLGGSFTAPRMVQGGPSVVAMDGPGGPIIGGTIGCVTARPEHMYTYFQSHI